jgi:ribosomal-protein-alanine N-acetyltransferase
MEKIAMTCDPGDDFENPRIEVGSPLRPHVLYRIGRGGEGG